MEEALQKVYQNFRRYFYKNVFQNISRQHGQITLAEAFDVGAIYVLGQPTMSEFAQFVGVSRPGATYRVNSLVEKGLVRRAPSAADRRENRLQVTERFLSVATMGDRYVQTVAQRVQARFSPEEVQCFGRILRVIAGELMEETKVSAGDLAE